VKLIFHGAAREVGRSCIEVQTKGDRYLLDCGVKFVTEGFQYPETVFDVPKLDGVLISHAHLDHTGGLPFFEHFNLVCPIFLTHQTFAITKILLKDSYKIAHIKRLHPAWDKTDLKEVQKDAHRVQFDKWYKHRHLKFMYLNAGHIPGSAMILLDNEGKRVLYTGDFNTRTTKLMEPANFAAIKEEHGPIHTLITESTYGHRKLPPRKDVEPEFVAAIRRVIARGGSVLIPVFALGRAQEILIMLADHDFGCPIYFDGMAKEITRKVLNHQSTYVINKEKLHTMLFDRVELVSSQERRIAVAQKQQAIFITTSGMMQGGPAIMYLKHMWHEKRNAVFLTGYQVHGTNGRHLIDEGYVHIDGWKTPVKCEVQKFDFSGHADLEDIQKVIYTLEPEQVIVQHGDEESVLNLLAWLKKTPFTGYGPDIGDEIEVK
jgi:putative mRNA 3-end processing factor